MNAWSQLPNAALIDWVLQSVKDNPELWDAAWDLDRDARSVARAWEKAWMATENADRIAARDAVEEASILGKTAWDALAALVAYDDCDGYLQMTYEQLHAWALLSETPQSVLLLPLKWVQEHEHECLVTPA